jgi:hypothetical protein
MRSQWRVLRPRTLQVVAQTVPMAATAGVEAPVRATTTSAVTQNNEQPRNTYTVVELCGAVSRLLAG